MAGEDGSKRLAAGGGRGNAGTVRSPGRNGAQGGLADLGNSVREQMHTLFGRCAAPLAARDPHWADSQGSQGRPLGSLFGNAVGSLHRVCEQVCPAPFSPIIIWMITRGSFGQVGLAHLMFWACRDSEYVCAPRTPGLANESPRGLIAGRHLERSTKASPQMPGAAANRPQAVTAAAPRMR